MADGAGSAGVAQEVVEVDRWAGEVGSVREGSVVVGEVEAIEEEDEEGLDEVVRVVVEVEDEAVSRGRPRRFVVPECLRIAVSKESPCIVR